MTKHSKGEAGFTLLEALVACLNAGLSPFTRELGSLGTGDLTSLSDIALALLGEGRVWRGDELVDAGDALAAARIAPARLGPRDGLAFLSSNAVTIGKAALLVVDAWRLLDAWLSVAALSFEAAGADPVVLDARIHSAAHRPGQSAIAGRMRSILDGFDRLGIVALEHLDVMARVAQLHRNSEIETRRPATDAGDSHGTHRNLLKPAVLAWRPGRPV